MYINSILIYDYIKNKINKFNFSKNINLLVSTTNKQGKSSLIKSIYYTLGFYIKIWPSNWDFKNMVFQIEISHNNIEYLITRHKDLFYINGKELILSEIEFSLWLQELLYFKIQIKDKKSKELVEVYASEVLMPFYIDQDKSWNGYIFSKTSDSFARYSNTTKNIFEFYFNINSMRKLELEVTKSKYEKDVATLNKQIEALGLLENTHKESEPQSYIPDLNISEKPLEDAQLEIYISQLNKINHELSKFDAEILNIDKKSNIIMRDNLELEKLKSSYSKRLKEIEYTCIYCNSNLTEEQSLTRLKIRNNIFEIEERRNRNIKNIDKLRIDRDELLNAKQEYVNKHENISSILSNRNIQSFENLIENKVHQELFNTFRATEGKILNNRESYLLKIEEIKKEISQENKLGKVRKDDISKEFSELINEYELALNNNSTNDIKINDIKFCEFKEVSGSGNDANIKMLAMYTLYSNLISQNSSVVLPFGMDSFLKNETSNDFKKNMFSFLSTYYLTIPTQIFFSIIEENLPFIDEKIKYHKVMIKKPILVNLDTTNDNLLETISFLQTNLN